MTVIVVHTCCTFHVLERARVCVLCQARGKTLGQGNIPGQDILGLLASSWGSSDHKSVVTQGLGAD